MNEEEMKEEIRKISQALLGLNGHDGLLKMFEDHKKSDEEFRDDYYNFKRKCIGLFYFVVGASGIGFGIFNLF